MNKEVAAILAHTLPEAQHLKAEVKVGERGGFSIFSRKKPPLQRLFRARSITFDQLLAGELLETLAHISGIYAPTGMALGERIGGSGGRGMSERQMEAWQRYFKACKEIHRTLGPETQQTVVQVAVYGYAPRETQLLPVNRRMDAVRDGLQIAHDFLFTPRALTATI